YDCVKKTKVMSETIVLGFNKYTEEPLFLETFEDMLIRVLKSFGTPKKAEKQRVLADNAFHPSSPTPEWRGTNACLPCCMPPWSGNIRIFECKHILIDGTKCNKTFFHLSDWGFHARLTHGV